MSEKEYIIVKDYYDKDVKYVPIFTPDWNDFAHILKRAKGPDRSMGEFAQACGLSPATFTRIVKGYYKKRLSEEILRKIVTNADSKSGITLSDLVYANGYRREGFSTGSPVSDSESVRNEDGLIPYELNSELSQKDLYDILSKEFFNIGLEFTTYSFLNKEKVMPPSKLSLNRFVDLESSNIVTFHLQGYELKYFKYSGCISREYDIVTKENSKEEAREILWRKLRAYLPLFLIDAWEPEATRDFYYTIVFRVESAFNLFVETMQNIRINNYISAILVDIDERIVKKEFAIPRVSGDTITVFSEYLEQ